jgi:hypothetical protein
MRWKSQDRKSHFKFREIFFKFLKKNC